jgi:hypothetical protein
MRPSKLKVTYKELDKISTEDSVVVNKEGALYRVLPEVTSFMQHYSTSQLEPVRYFAMIKFAFLMLALDQVMLLYNI